MPPSTNRPKSRPIWRAVAGDTAFTSTYRPSNPNWLPCSATSTAAAGGQTEMTTSTAATNDSRVPRSTNFASLALAAVASDRPSLAQRTSPSRHAASAAPMLPG